MRDGGRRAEPHERDATMTWTWPNVLTASRLPLAAAFFVLVGLYAPEDRAFSQGLLIAALAVFALAGITDFLDGYLARRLNQLSTFGRMVDPVVDKVLIVGGFAMLAGRNYAMSAAAGLSSFEQDLPFWLTGRMTSAVQSWMVVVILAREFIVSAVRGYSESQGVKFPATSAGKIKFNVQVAAIIAVLVHLAVFPGQPWVAIVKIAAVWSAVAVTVVSGLTYLNRARSLLAGGAGRGELT